MKYLTAIFSLVVIVLLFTAAQKKDENKTPEEVSFSKDVLPVLTKKCLDCHTTDDDSANKFYVDNYDVLMKESKHGASIQPGKGDESAMIKKMRGTADFGAKMPKRGKPVPDSVVAIIAKWIDQGAKKN